MVVDQTWSCHDIGIICPVAEVLDIQAKCTSRRQVFLRTEHLQALVDGLHAEVSVVRDAELLCVTSLGIDNDDSGSTS